MKYTRIHKLIPTAVLGAVLLFGVIGLVGLTRVTHAAQPTVNLRSATPFAILAGTPGITDVAFSSDITGNVGLAPATGAGIGLNCSQVTGTIYSVDAAGPLPCRQTNGPLMVTAKNDLTTAFDDAAGRTPVTIVPTELGGTTLTTGTYAAASTTFEITAGAGPLIIDGQNDPSAVFIFEMDADGTGLTVGPGSTVSLINGASACNIFWRVDTATINTTAVFKGTILALTSITVADGANIEGRLLARNGSVSLDNDTITVPAACATAPSSDDSSGSGAATPKLPNTGVAPQEKTIPWNVIVVSGVVALPVLLYFARKRMV